MLLTRKPQSLVAHPRADAHDRPLAPRPNRLPAQSHLDASVRVTGDLYSRGDIQLEGQVCGNVTCAQLILGPDATVTGAILAEEAVIRGRVIGTVRANAVIMQATADVEADITYTCLALDQGARFEGIARRSLDPLHEESAPSALADLQQMIATPPVAAPAGNGRDAGAQQPPHTPDPTDSEPR